MRGGHERRLIELRQFLPLGQVDDVVALAAAFPPARVIIVFRDLVEAELLVVIRADPFRRVDGAFLKRRIDVAAGELLRHYAEARQDRTGEPANPEFYP